ncbi:MAG TPA: polymer-forming cytoskeletal protein, partial [Stellaceae bacterium]|nr:polymer-forming cytoskeletal protein [Stellaceae bacterium]
MASDNSRFSTRQQGSGLSPGGAPVLPSRPSEVARPGIERPPGTSSPTAAHAGLPGEAPRRSETAQRTLIVGREIGLSGEITSCDRLVVEGSVQANLANCREIDIAESGLFKGSASIDEAEIRGRFEGTLIARKRLHIRSTGKVAATVSYAQIEIEAGGQLSGAIEVLSPGATAPAPRTGNSQGN